jgi:hypothetical protein
MTTKSNRHTYELPWSEVLIALPLTAQYLKLFAASRAYDYHNRKDMETTWREVAPIIGTRGHATVDDIKFTLGVNKCVKVLPQFVDAQSHLSFLHKAKYKAQVNAAKAGQGVITTGPNFNVTGSFPQADDIAETISDELLSLTNVVRSSITSTYSDFRSKYPTAAASLYRRHLFRKVEAKLKGLFPRCIEELLLWGSNASDFNIGTAINNVQPIVLAVYEQTNYKAACDQSPEGIGYQSTIADLQEAIASYMTELGKADKTYVQRTHYVTTQHLTPAKRISIPQSKAKPQPQAKVQAALVA